MLNITTPYNILNMFLAFVPLNPYVHFVLIKSNVYFGTSFLVVSKIIKILIDITIKGHRWSTKTNVSYFWGC